MKALVLRVLCGSGQVSVNDLRALLRGERPFIDPNPHVVRSPLPELFLVDVQEIDLDITVRSPTSPVAATAPARAETTAPPVAATAPARAGTTAPPVAATAPARAGTTAPPVAASAPARAGTTTPPVAASAPARAGTTTPPVAASAPARAGTTTPPVAASAPPVPLDTRLMDYRPKLPARFINAMHRDGHKTMKDLSQHGADILWSTPYIGTKTILDVRDALKANGMDWLIDGLP